VKTYLAPKFLVQRDPDRCIGCQVCVNQCTFDAHYYDAEDDKVRVVSRVTAKKWLDKHHAFLSISTSLVPIVRLMDDYFIQRDRLWEQG